MSKSIIADYAKNMCQNAFDNFESFKMYGGGRRGIVIGHSVYTNQRCFITEEKMLSTQKFVYVKIWATSFTEHKFASIMDYIKISVLNKEKK